MCRTKKVGNVSTEEKNSEQAFLGAVEFHDTDTVVEVTVILKSLSEPFSKIIKLCKRPKLTEASGL